MADHYKDEVLDHEYDGITEYDNPMPGWWLALYALCIVWAVVYVVGIGFGILPDYQDDLRDGQKELADLRREYEKTRPVIVIDEGMLLAAAADPLKVAQGGEVYTSYCASCHGDLGQGMVGPNLTDDYWLHGQKATQIHQVVRDGVDGKGMPPWGNIITPEQSVDVVAYVASLRGTNPPKAKGPQGELLEPVPEGDVPEGDAPADPAPADPAPVVPAPAGDAPANPAPAVEPPAVDVPADGATPAPEEG